MQSKIKTRSHFVKACILFLTISLSGLTYVFGDELFDGGVSFNPPFPMTHHDNPSEALPISSLTYNGTNDAAEVTFIGTVALWFAQKPDSVTNSIDTISGLKSLIDTNYKKRPGWTTNVAEKIVKFQGRDAIEFSGSPNGLWHDQIIMFWTKSRQWERNTVFVIDAQAQTKEVCKLLVKAVTVCPPINSLNSSAVSGADLLNDPVLGGGNISYGPPFYMPHRIEAGSVMYQIGDTAVSFTVQRLNPIHSKNGQVFFSDTNVPSIKELEQELESVNQFQLTNIVAKRIKLDGRQAMEFSGEKIGHTGVPEAWIDIIAIFWHQDTHWSGTKVLCVFVATDSDKDVFQKLVKSVKAAKYYPPK
jgi:hypothetical protein